VLVSLERVHKVAVGLRHMCAIAGDSRAVFCWGADASDAAPDLFGLLGSYEAYGLGSDTPVEVNGGVAVPRLTSVLDLVAGFVHTCAVTMDHELLCWGDYHNGRLGFVSSEDPGPDYVLNAEGKRIVVQQVSLGLDHSCALTNDQHVLCWGSNASGQLGYPADHDFSNGAGQLFRAYADVVPGLENITAIEAGVTHSCAIDRDKRVWCWGGNQFGELGREDTQTTHTPKVVAGVPAARSVSAGTFNTCMIGDSADGSVWCWGARATGFMGLPLEGTQVTPAKLDVQAARALSVSETLCVLSERGVMGCLGANDQGQLGTNTLPSQTPTLSLTQIAPLH
jgi:alpha-tubulin suppressor-like RCC1 family protein